jgi:hypothetical protein
MNAVYQAKTSKNSIREYGDPTKFLEEVNFLFGKSSHFLVPLYERLDIPSGYKFHAAYSMLGVLYQVQHQDI